ncbi:unnamed protein product [Phytomonas sp. EM1]|nr:unnamed protein product [Phytomonas sp. EM1]|eukprot:CCW61974.1 unnamed protein product [Phytomonas sp. isolate EM1]
MWSQFLHAHTASVTSLCFSPHEAVYPHLLCSTSGDETIALWDYYSGESIARLWYHREPVNHALFLPDDPHLLLTASDDGRVALWDLRRHEHPLGVLSDFREGVNKVILLPFSCVPDGVDLTGSSASTFFPPPRPRYLTASACDDGMVYLHAIFPPSALLEDRLSNPDPDDGEREGGILGRLLDRFVVSISTVNDLVLIPGGEILLTASEDGAVRGWRLGFPPSSSSSASPSPSDRLLLNLDEFENPVNHLAIVPRGWMGDPQETPAPAGAPFPCWVLAASSEGVFGIALRPPAGAPDPDVRVFVGHADYVRGIDFTPARTLLTVADDGTAMEWGLPTAQAIRQVRLHEGLVMAAALAPDGAAFATGSDTGEIRVWRQPFQTEALAGVPEAVAG